MLPWEHQVHKCDKTANTDGVVKWRLARCRIGMNRTQIMKRLIIATALAFIGGWTPRVDAYCAPYMGKVCRNYLNSTTMFWYSDEGGWNNDKITTSLWEELIVTLKEPCRSSAEVNYNSHMLLMVI